MTETQKSIAGVLVIVVIVGAIILLEHTKTTVNLSNREIADTVIVVENSAERVAEKEREYERVKEISTPDAIINAPEDFNLADLVGEKVILVDFWTYSCINCQRTLPYLNDWHDEYADDGLVIVGVHTPEFEFEKDYDNVLRAVEKWGIEYPVVMDNDYSTWQSYRNRYWPRKYLIDIDGFIVYDHIGEGGYDETEEKIVELLNEKMHYLDKQLSPQTRARQKASTQLIFVRLRVERHI